MNQEIKMFEQIQKQKDQVRAIPIDSLIGGKIFTTDATLEKELNKYGYVTRTIKRKGYWSIYIEKKEENLKHD